MRFGMRRDVASEQQESGEQDERRDNMRDRVPTIRDDG